MVSMMLTACGSKEQADVVQTTDMPAVQETDADVNTSIAEEDAPKAEKDISDYFALGNSSEDFSSLITNIV